MDDIDRKVDSLIEMHREDRLAGQETQNAPPEPPQGPSPPPPPPPPPDRDPLAYLATLSAGLSPALEEIKKPQVRYMRSLGHCSVTCILLGH